MIRSLVSFALFSSLATFASAAPARSQTPVWEIVGSPGISSGTVMCCQIASDRNGVVHVAYQDQALGPDPASVQCFANGAWSYVGSPGAASIAQAWYNHIAFDLSGAPHVVSRDYGVFGKANVRRFDPRAGTWSDLGFPGPSAGEAHYTALAVAGDGTTYIAYADRSTVPGDRATVLRCSNGFWTGVGSPGFSDASAEYVSIALGPGDVPYVAFGDRARLDPTNAPRISVMRFDAAASLWSYVGLPGFSPTGGTHARIAFDRTGAPCVVYQQYHIALHVLRFDGSAWQPIGGSASSWDRPAVETESWRQWLSLAFDSQNAPYVAYQRLDHQNRAAVRRFDGTVWAPVGALDFSPPNADYMAMTLDPFDVPWVVFRDWTFGGKATVMCYAPSPHVYCTAATDSIGCNPNISAATVPTASGPRVTMLSARGVVSHSVGKLVYSTRPTRTPFQGGTLCVAAPYRSVGRQRSGGSPSGADCTGALVFDFGSLVASGVDPSLVPGAVVFAQFWYRDPWIAGGAGLTDAVRFAVEL